jgi:uncharacterized ferredoxin-like protein
MKYDGKALEDQGLLEVARLMCVAARTAPKGRGRDNLVTLLLTEQDREPLITEMKRLYAETSAGVFGRDAETLQKVPALLLLGTKLEQLGLTGCGFCGFKDCDDNKAHNGICAFNTGDLGIALGSAVSVAADHRVDTRILFSAGRAALNLHLLGEEVKIAYGIPLSVSAKNPFFDRKR